MMTNRSGGAFGMVLLVGITAALLISAETRGQASRNNADQAIEQERWLMDFLGRQTTQPDQSSKDQAETSQVRALQNRVEALSQEVELLRQQVQAAKTALPSVGEQVRQFYEWCGLPFAPDQKASGPRPVDFNYFDGNHPTPDLSPSGLPRQKATLERLGLRS